MNTNYANPDVSGGSGYGGIHATLNAASIAMDATGVGAAFSWAPDLADAGLSAFEGDWTGAGISMASMIPFVGITANAGKLGHIASRGMSALEAASNAAFKAVENIDKFIVSAKHLPGAGGRWAKFAQGVDPHQAIKEALSSANTKFLPNPESDRSFIIITDLGREVGSKGETALRVVFGEDGVIWTAYPVWP